MERNNIVDGSMVDLRNDMGIPVSGSGFRISQSLIQFIRFLDEEG